ncbi:MAG: Cof-type HAD-IIB family hydrolase [Acholeplasmatales bacterium]|nr:MAG: Cof-type HAD-IIB family hydrolase [Acholeplasmatales bacterium]
MSKKLILLDLDGTVIDTTTHQVPDTAYATIKALQDAGHLVAIATGRHPSHFFGIDTKLNITSIIAANGRLVKVDGQVIHTDIIDPKVVDAFVTDMSKAGIDVGFESPDMYALGSENTPWPAAFHHYFNLGDAPVITSFHHQHPILQMVLYGDELDADQLAQQYPNLNFIRSCPYGLDVNTPGGLKEKGAEILRQHHGIQRENIIAVGDGYNDLGMIRYAQIGIAMGNACEALKAAADMTTETATHDGLMYAFKRMGLI